MSDDLVTIIKSVSAIGRMRLYSEAAPNAKFIHIIRHPCGYLASLKRGVEKSVMNPRSYYEDFVQTRTAQSLPYTEAEIESWPWHKQIVFTWLVLNLKIHQEMADNPNYHIAYYDALAVNPEEGYADLFQKCGLEWTDQTSAFLKKLSSMPKTTKGYFSVMKPPGEQMTRWKKELTEQEIEEAFSVIKGTELEQYAPI